MIFATSEMISYHSANPTKQTESGVKISQIRRFDCISGISVGHIVLGANGRFRSLIVAFLYIVDLFIDCFGI